MTTPARHLFVYGLLMGDSTDGHGAEERERLKREAKSLGPATIRGRLYHLGSYPGLVVGDDGRDLVHGEVLLLDEPEETFRWLDEFEDYYANEPERNVYARETRPIRLNSGETVEAWVYVYVSCRAGARHIATGRWWP